MGKYIVKRVLQFIPVFLGVTLILFALQNIVPGDPIKLIGGDKALSPEVELQLRVRYHLVQTDDDGNAILDENGDPVQTSLVDRYLYYMNGLLHGDLGNSYQRKLPVTEIFAQKYPYTVKLAACAIVLEAIMGIGAGIISAVKRYSFWDILVTLTTSILVAVPAFWLGMLLQLFFGVILKDATGGAISMPISGAGGSSSQYQDWMHYVGVDFGGMLSGAILTETVFNWPGIGYEVYRAISMRDWPIVMGGVTLIVVVVMVINLLVDISYAFLDPRIRLGGPSDKA